MRLSEAKDCIKELYRNSSAVPALISERGVGKTSAFQQCAEELEIGYIGLYAAALEGPDFMGLPDKDSAKGITRYLAPQFLPTRKAVEEKIYPDRGLLIIEEINRVPADTASVLYPLLLEKRINGHELAPGWSIGVTMNPDTMNYLVNALDDALIDRFISIEIDPNLDDYLDFSLQNEPNEKVLTYLTACPDMLLAVKTASDSSATSKAPTPRGWTRVQELLNKCRLPQPLLQELIAGIVGFEAAAAFIGFSKDHNLPLPDSRRLLTEYSVERPKVQRLIEAGRMDRIHYLLKRTAMLMEADSDRKSLNRFLSDLPEEMQILFFKYVSARRSELFENLSETLPLFEDISDRMIDLYEA